MKQRNERPCVSGLRLCPMSGGHFPFSRETLPWYFLSARRPSAAAARCRGCNISELTSRLLSPQAGRPAVFSPPLLSPSFPVLERSCCGVVCLFVLFLNLRTCLTSCFLAGAPTTTCPRKWPIGWGWSWARWSRRNSATRRHGEYICVFMSELSPPRMCVCADAASASVSHVGTLARS